MKIGFQMCVIGGCGMLGLLVGCASGPAFNGPRPGETWYVSTERVVVRQNADALSPAVREMAYSNPVAVEKDVRVVPAFAGDRSKFPEDLIPGWVKVVDGYVPVSSLASGWLIRNQNVNESFSSDGMLVAQRGFSNSENDAEGASIRGAAGNGKVAENGDLLAVERLLKTDRQLSDAEVHEFLRAGQLSHVPVPAEVLNIAGKGAVGNVLDGALQGTASGLGSVSAAVAQQDDAGSGLVGGMGNLVAGLIYSESGPVQEFQLGKGVAARILPNYVVPGQNNVYAIVPPTDPRAAYVVKVGTALAAASNDPMPYKGYQFILLDATEINAFAVPGGFVFVTTGMLNFLKDEDELAAILGHEIGHMELRHGMSAVGKEKVLKLFSLVKKIMTQPPTGQQESVLQARLRGLIDEVFANMTEAIRNGYGRDIESQADWRSLQLASILGYDTKALHEVLERFKTTKGSYGGAGYPAERGQDVLTYRTQLGYSDIPSIGRSIRAARYRTMLGK